ncbi:hypothetical protein FACS189454_03040 [Planctomycetales bacterium]|nr:hypothetical protein FACS189454_03040 [Planctomycetales bacterium]
MNRRRLLFFVLPAIVSITSTFISAAEQSTQKLTADILKKTLWAKTPSEDAYCDFVIAQRNAKMLPEKILVGVYQKSLGKDRSRRMVYFQKALESACKTQGVKLQNPTTQTAAKKKFLFF